MDQDNGIVSRIIAVMRAESAGDVRAVSSAGEMALLVSSGRGTS